MTDTTAQKMIVDAVTFNAETDCTYTKPKVNPSGGKSIGIINSTSNKGLYIYLHHLCLLGELMTFVDDNSGRKTYDMSLQFPKEEYKTDTTGLNFLQICRHLEARI